MRRKRDIGRKRKNKKPERKVRFCCDGGPFAGRHIWISSGSLREVCATMIFRVKDFYGRYEYYNSSHLKWRDM